MKSFFTLSVGLFLSFGLLAQAPEIKYDTLATGLSSPLDIASPADGSGRVFVVQQGGLIRIWNGSAFLPTPFLNVSSAIVSGGERGLLSLAFHPDYATNRYFFIYYTKAGNGSLTIARYRTSENNPDVADATSGVEILNIPHPNNTNHNGGKLNFGKDGYLYIGTGDGGGSNDPGNNAQNGNSLLGKMLRIDVNDFTDVTPPLYSIPPTNPYINNAAVADEIIALGLRNPFRWSFDRLTGDMWIGDVGQSAREEVNFRAAADINSPTNYGWRCREGSIANPNANATCPTPPNHVQPVFDYQRNAAGGYVITGGYVYRGPEFPNLAGYYICTDYSTGNIWLIRPNGVGGWNVTAQTVNKVTNISGLGEAEDGTLYAVKLNQNNVANTGMLLKVVTEVSLPLRLQSFTGHALAGMDQLLWDIQGTSGDRYIIERKTADGDSFSEVATVHAVEGQRLYSVQLPSAATESMYRIKVLSMDGSVNFSPIIRLRRQGLSDGVFTANIAGDGIVLQMMQPTRSIRLVNSMGVVVYQREMKGQMGMLHIPASHMARQVLFIQVTTEKGTAVKKIAW